MKKLILIIALISFPLTSQDKEPESWECIWGHSSTPRPFDVDSFQQKSVMVGFQWGGSTRMNNALGNNASTICTKNLCFFLS